MFQDCVRRINRDLVICCIAVLHAEVVVLKIDVEVRKDQAVFNELPDDASHFIAVEFDDGIVNLDLCHGEPLFPHPVMSRISLVSDLYTIAQPAGMPPTI